METFDQRQWLSWMIRVRVIIISFLLGIQLIIQQAAVYQHLIIVQVPMKYFIAVLVFWYLLDLIFQILLKIEVDLRLQSYLQTVLDSTLVTLVVYFTGGIDSFFYFLYPLTILTGSIILSRAGAYIVASLCFVESAVMMLLPYLGMLPFYGLEAPDLRSMQLKVATNLVAFYAVAYLAGKLADVLRRTGVELRHQTGRLEDLRALNHEIIESMRGGVITTDLEGRIAMMNTPGAEILHTSYYMMAGRPVDTIFPGVLGENGPDLSRPRREILWKGPHGEQKYLGLSIAPLSRNGETAGYVYNFQDLTQLKQLEQEIQLKDRMAAIGRMAAAIAHEVRNPLASITGSVKLFSGMMNLGEDQQRLIEIVLKESERLDSMVKEFLLYAREKPYQFTVANLAEVLEETLTLLENHPLMERGCRVERKLTPGPVWAWVDTDRVRQVFWNLGDNALKAMPSGGTLTVELQAEGGRAAILFRDTGIGIKPRQLEKIFEPFQSEFEKGTGLGLAIAYQIVQAHKGTIRAESGGTGSVFRIELPLAPAPAEEIPATTLHGQSARS